jgi:catechol 2,3-dioxygenase-like lactoylglutathione lyase family enzyme
MHWTDGGARPGGGRPRVRDRQQQGRYVGKLSRIRAVDHVHIEAAPEYAEELRWFYGELAGLEEVQEVGADAGMLRFRSAQIEIHIHLLDGAEIETVDERVTVAVPSFAAVKQELQARQVPFQLIRGLIWTDQRLSLLDPAGNRVVLCREWPFAPI